MAFGPPEPRLRGPAIVERSAPLPPLWVDDWVGAAPLLTSRLEGCAVETRSAADFFHISVKFDGVEEMDATTFERRVAHAYGIVFERLDALGLHPLRVWAFIPGIHVPSGTLDRYKVFNAGRFAACSARLGGRWAFAKSIPTSSAVGSGDAALHLHCIGARRPGRPVENPRQIPAYRYSSLFGPLPPCFARATLLAPAPGRPEILLVGGTASIVGEESRHLGDLSGQISETLSNLAAVVRSACGEPATAHFEGPEALRVLAEYRELRIYHREARALGVILGRVGEAFPGVTRIETRQAELCRGELLVEIEGLAVLPPRVERREA